MNLHPGDDDTVLLALAFHDDGQVEVWSREGMPGNELAELLRQAAAGFDVGGNARRVQ